MVGTRARENLHRRVSVARQKLASKVVGSKKFGRRGEKAEGRGWDETEPKRRARETEKEKEKEEGRAESEKHAAAGGSERERASEKGRERERERERERDRTVRKRGGRSHPWPREAPGWQPLSQGTP